MALANEIIEAIKKDQDLKQKLMKKLNRTQYTIDKYLRDNDGDRDKLESTICIKILTKAFGKKREELIVSKKKK